MFVNVVHVCVCSHVCVRAIIKQRECTRSCGCVQREKSISENSSELCNHQTTNHFVSSCRRVFTVVSGSAYQKHVSDVRSSFQSNFVHVQGGRSSWSRRRRQWRLSGTGGLRGGADSRCDRLVQYAAQRVRTGLPDGGRPAGSVRK